MPQHSVHEEYDFFRKGMPIHKKVTYFIAEIKGEVSLQQAEIQSSQWVDLAQAEELDNLSSKQIHYARSSFHNAVEEAKKQQQAG